MLRTIICAAIRANTLRLLAGGLTAHERAAILAENNRLRELRAAASPLLTVHPPTPVLEAV